VQGKGSNKTLLLFEVLDFIGSTLQRVVDNLFPSVYQFGNKWD
jgi:hypothetical protein